MALFAGILVGALIALGINYALPIFLKARAIKDLGRRCRETRSLVLTYDDGPSSLTPKVLEVLAQHGAQATFFVPGARAESQLQLLTTLCAQGHEVGVHSHEHLHAWRVSPWSAHRDAVAGWGILKQKQIPSTLYRPAYGKITATTWRTLRRAGAAIAWWTIDSGDSDAALEKGRAERALLGDGGGVVLLHDLGRNADHESFVLETTHALLNLARREGIRVLPMGELLGVERA